MLKKLLFNWFIVSVLITCVSAAYPADAKVVTPEKVSFEYNGKVIDVEMSDLIIMNDGSLTLADPQKYANELGDALYSPANNTQIREVNPYTGETVYSGSGSGKMLTPREYEEEQQAKRWLNVVEDLEKRDIDREALALVKEFHGAKNGVPPTLGQTGDIVFAYQTYIPKVVCRPMYVTDIILEPGEIVNGVHPGDATRWVFVPGEVGEGKSRQISVLVKPLMPDISTNLVIMTNKRRYNLNLMSSAKEYMPSVSFTYPAEALKDWDNFIQNRRDERKLDETKEEGYVINPEDLHLNYKIEGKNSIRWKPVAAYDDGVKTYLRFSQKSAIRSVEAPVFVVFEKKKQIVVNYRFIENDMMVIDKVFEVGALIVGSGALQDRVVIRRLSQRTGAK